MIWGPATPRQLARLRHLDQFPGKYIPNFAERVAFHETVMTGGN
jgi:hypothetical protein